MDVDVKARKVLKELGFEFATFTLESFLQAAGRSRGRSIEVFACDLPTDVLGVWLTDTVVPTEYIFYQKGLPDIQQIHVQLHEVSHFLMGHQTRRINRQALIEAAQRGTPISLLEEIVQLRSPRIAAWEVEAETLSSLIQKQAIRYSTVGLLTQHSTHEEQLTDFLRGMGS